jgi:hypothetical protein
MRLLRAFLQLPAPERRWLIEVAALLWAIRVGLWLLPFGTLRRLLDGAGRPAASALRADRLPAERIGWALAAASCGVVRATCLTQALAAQLLLARRGQPAVLRIGVAKDATGKLEAHAWVECQGQIVVGGPAEHVARYQLLPAWEAQHS